MQRLCYLPELALHSARPHSATAAVPHLTVLFGKERLPDHFPNLIELTRRNTDEKYRHLGE